jgi:hypothetical protein
MSVLTPFQPAVTEQQVKACEDKYEAKNIIGALLDLGSYLVSIDQHTTMLNAAKDDPYSPSLKTLLDRLNTGFVTLSPLSSLAKDAVRLRKTVALRVKRLVTERPLEDFEDLYYALLARLQDMGQVLSLRVSNGFNPPSEAVCKNGPPISELYDSLVSYWDMLNDPVCVRALDDAIRQSRVNIIYREINAELNAAVITSDDAEELLLDLFENRDVTDGIAWIGAWSPAMIGAYLTEKYRIAMQVQKEDDERIALAKRKRMAAKAKKPLGSPIKRRSVEKIRRGPAKQAHFVQQRQDAVGHPTQHVVNDQERFRQEQLRRDREWQLKTQRVSEYSNYLRGAASHDARSIIDGSAYGDSMNGSTVFGSLGQQTPEKDSDEMDI